MGNAEKLEPEIKQFDGEHSLLEQVLSKPKELLIDAIARGETQTSSGEPITRDALVAELADRPNMIESLEQQMKDSVAIADRDNAIPGFTKSVNEILGEDCKLDVEEAFSTLIDSANEYVRLDAIDPPQPARIEKFSAELKGFSREEITALAAYENLANADLSRVIKALSKAHQELEEEHLPSKDSAPQLHQNDDSVIKCINDAMAAQGISPKFNALSKSELDISHCFEEVTPKKEAELTEDQSFSPEKAPVNLVN